MIQKPAIVVLDTNVCLDLFVFCDPRWNALLAALRSGELQAVTRADCRREWEIVLDYRHLPARALLPQPREEFDSLICCRDDLPPLDDIKLPLCSDPDDQKFLEVAWQAGAHYLITKDKALLKLARKTARNGWFQILQPQAWPPAAPAGVQPAAVQSALDT